MEKALAYRIAAYWHDDRADDAEQMMTKFPKGSFQHTQARVTAQDHRKSASGLRFAADQIDGSEP